MAVDQGKDGLNLGGAHGPQFGQERLAGGSSEEVRVGKADEASSQVSRKVEGDSTAKGGLEPKELA